MGLGVFGSVLVLALLFKHLASQQPNTDEFFVSEFLKKMMGLASSQGYNFSASVCSWGEIVLPCFYIWLYVSYNFEKVHEI